MTPDLPDLGLQPAREILGLTGDDLAARLGVNPRTVRSWEQGRDRVPAGVWVDVAGLLAAADAEVERVRVEWTATGVEPEQPADAPDRWWRHVLARAVIYLGA